MCLKLKLLRERKLHELFASEDKKSLLEASGVYATNPVTCHVIFDNKNAVGCVDLSLEPTDNNHLTPVLNVGIGFEDITFDPKNQRYHLIIEALKNGNKKFQGLVSEYDKNFGFRRCTLLEPTFKKRNKGFEGVGHFWRGNDEYLVGLAEAATRSKEHSGSGLLYVFRRAYDGTWVTEREIELPPSARFKDYAAIALRQNRVAVVSQESRRVWIGEINDAFNGFNQMVGDVYRFPTDNYCNVEGVSWVSDNQLVMVSDCCKKDQKKRCREKDQSIHLFQIATA